MSPTSFEGFGSVAHLVQFYDCDTRVLIRNVARYLGDGLRQGEAVAVIATGEHIDAFARQLEQDGVNANRAVREGRMVCRDAEETLAQFMAHGWPEWERFEVTVNALIRELRAASSGARIRAYGEMVDVLWNAGRSAAAVRLEQFWNRLQAAAGFSLFCSYQIDVFGREFQAAVVDGLLCTHTQLVPADSEGRLDRALDRALRDVLGPVGEDVERRIAPDVRPSWAVIPKGEAKILWLRNNLRAYSDEIMTRARGYYEQAT